MLSTSTLIWVITADPRQKLGSLELLLRMQSSPSPGTYGTYEAKMDLSYESRSLHTFAGAGMGSIWFASHGLGDQIMCKS